MSTIKERTIFLDKEIARQVAKCVECQALNDRGELALWSYRYQQGKLQGLQDARRILLNF